MAAVLFLKNTVPISKSFYTMYTYLLCVLFFTDLSKIPMNETVYPPLVASDQFRCILFLYFERRIYQYFYLFIQLYLSTTLSFYLFLNLYIYFYLFLSIYFHCISHCVSLCLFVFFFLLYFSFLYVRLCVVYRKILCISLICYIYYI